MFKLVETWMLVKSLMIKQAQKSGSHSTNVQAQSLNITNGLSYGEAKEIAQDVFNTNFFRLSSAAHEIAEKRVAELIEGLLLKLSLNLPEVPSSINDPDFQYILFEAQKQYARNGNPQSKELLINLLTKRINSPSALEVIISNEAIVTISKLTSDQLLALKLLYILTEHKPNYLAQNIKDHLVHFVMPIVKKIKIGTADFEHLLYTSCCNKESQKNRLADIYQNAFPQELATQDVNGYIIQQCPEIKPFFPLWNSRGFCLLSLTSVGKYIGQVLFETDEIVKQVQVVKT